MNEQRRSRSTEKFLYILVALIAGLTFGMLFGRVAAQMDVVSIAFIQAIKMIVVPLIFPAVTLGSYRLGTQPTGIGRITFLAFAWFFFSTFVAALLGLTLDALFHPGIGIDLHPAGAATASATLPDWRHFILDLIPSNVVAAMAGQKILPLLLFGISFGIALAHVGEERARPIVVLLESIFDTIFRLTHWIVKLVPLAVFAVSAWFAATQPLNMMLTLGKFVLLVYFGFACVVLLCLLALALLGRGQWSFLRLMVEPAIVGFASRSSEVALPIHMENLIEGGIDRRIVSTIIPLAYSFNPDGAAVYMSLAVPFLAEVYGMHLAFTTLVVLLFTVLLASKGIANIPSGSLVAVASIATGIGLPPEALAILAGVDVFLDMGRTAVNVFGNTCAAVFVSRFGGLPPGNVDALVSSRSST